MLIEETGEAKLSACRRPIMERLGDERSSPRSLERLRPGSQELPAALQPIEPRLTSAMSSSKGAMAPAKKPHLLTL